MKRLLPLIALLMFPILVQAKSIYFVKVEITNSEQLIGSPALLLEQGMESKISEEGRYKLSLSATPSGSDKVLIKTVLDLDNETLAPSMLVELGKETRVSLGETTLRFTVKDASEESF